MLSIVRKGRQIFPAGRGQYKRSREWPIEKSTYKEAVPCIRERTSGPWKPISRSSRRWRAPQRQPRPAQSRVSIRLSTRKLFRPIRRASATYHGELVEWPGRLDVLQGSLEILEFEVDLLLGSHGVLDGFDLEGLDGLELAGHIVLGGLEGAEALLDLGDDGLVLEDGAVVGEVDGGGLLGQDLHLSAGVLVPLLESLQGGDGLAA